MVYIHSDIDTTTYMEFLKRIIFPILTKVKHYFLTIKITFDGKDSGQAWFQYPIVRYYGIYKHSIPFYNVYVL
jgi:hypothetical protein